MNIHFATGRGVRNRVLPILGLLLFALSARAAIPAGERQILLNLYTDTNGAGWTTSTGWNGAAGTECTWYGISCDGTNSHVTAVDLDSNNLTGSLPAINGLSALDDFEVRSNQLTGSIPSLTGLSLLQTFQVGANQITGSIPSLSGLSALVEFFASSDQLTGPIPSLTGLSALKDFAVDHNQLTGPIPSLSGLSELSY